MKHTRRIKTILASLLVAAALSVPSVVLSSELPRYNAELYIEGAGLEVMDDGSVQAIFNVSVDRLKNCQGAQFYLVYNGDYLTPSYIDDVSASASGDGKAHLRNEAITTRTMTNTDAFFRVDEELYGLRDTTSGELINPFMYSSERYKKGTNYYSVLNPNTKSDQKMIKLNLVLDTLVIGNRIQLNEDEDEVVVNGHGPAGKIKMVDGVSEQDRDTASSWLVEPVINHEDDEAEKVTLCQLSFRVTKKYLPEMLRLFQDLGKEKSTNIYGATDDPYETKSGNKSFLLRMAEEKEVPVNADDSIKGPWAMYTVEAQSDDSTIKAKNVVYGPNTHDEVHRFAEDLYLFSFEGKTAVDVELANPVFTINAYQNYTNGIPKNDNGDIALSLGRYSPMATVTYADGTKESFVVPWGQDPVSGIPTGYDRGLEGKLYDPTGGHFFPTQKLILERDKTNFRGEKVRDKNGDPVRESYAFPIAVKADMTVTPITLVDITAPDLERSYKVAQAKNEVKTGDDLALPTQARLLTDIVPSGVSLVMPIPGWSPTQPDSFWPDDEDDELFRMNVLLADEYSATTGTPYWPAGRDDLKDPTKHIGTYSFRKTDSSGALNAYYAEADVDALYPWLTTPDENLPENEDIYRLDDAVRRIVDDSEWTDADLYEAKYVSTTEPEGDPDKALKPTVTFSVRRKDGTSLKEGSVFRVWLPDGTELGTGLTTTGKYAAVTVDDWFNYAADDTGTVRANEGSYQAKGELDATSVRSFQLITNTGDPTLPEADSTISTTLAQSWEAQKAKRETLRRYINLGGWFNISVCEDPATMTWSEQMPVYVDPRTNIYLESKEYNFLGENADLLRFPTPVATTVTLPHGTYTAVDAKGDPLYDDKSGAPTTDGGSDGSSMKRPTLERWRESYGLSVLYDGQTGAQPGTLYRFTVDNTGLNVRNSADSWWDVTHNVPQGYADGQTTAGADIFRYGPAPLYNGQLYETMGRVYQEDLPLAVDDQDATLVPARDTETATLRREDGKEREVEWEEVQLTSAEPSGITTVLDEHGHSNVSLAVFDTVMEGYQVRQDYTFTLTNIGTTCIYGLTIDGLTDGYPADKTGGRFEMLQPPADYLAPGQSTTFVLTYVYDLLANSKADSPSVYRDTFYVTSDNHPNGGKDKVLRQDYLLDFDAEFTVSDSPLHQVELYVYPEKDNLSKDPYPMGTAEVIVGEQRGTTPSTMDYTAATRSYPGGQLVYILVEPKDEYSFKIVRTDPDGKEQELYPYKVDLLQDPDRIRPANHTDFNLGALLRGDAELDDGKMVYCFPMPADENAIVTVRFYEDLFSKLRLEDLIDFSAGNSTLLKTTTQNLTASQLPDPAETVAPENTYKVWRKSFTQDELDEAKDYSDKMAGGSSTTVSREDPQADLKLMTLGSAIPRSEGGEGFVPSENQYLVVIPYDANFSQIQATLRSITVDRSGLPRDASDGGDYLQPNENIDVQVTMAWYSYNCMDFYKDAPNGVGDLENITDTDYHKTIYQPTYGHVKDKDGNYVSNYIDEHVSQVFDSPAAGTSCYVRIRVEGNDGSTTVYRHYYVEIHRAPETPEATFNYGNSPYGMIMNDNNIQSTAGNDQKQVAKDKFKVNYSFAGVDADHIPTAVKNNANTTMRTVTYWREAWVKNRAVYEPESFTGQYQKYDTVTNDDGTTSQVNHRMLDDANVYVEADNLDLNDYAYFAILGEDLLEPGLKEAWDSSGRPIDVSKARVSAEVTLLDTAQTTQIGRFSGTATATLDLGWSAQLTESVAGGKTIPASGNCWPVSSTTATDADGNETVTRTEVTGIRPGRYRMRYTFTDFDGQGTLSVYRDFVILSPVGDVNVDLIRDNEGYSATDSNYRTSDEYVLENRIRDPLGYEVQLYTRAVTGADGVTRTEEVYPYANIFKFRVCDVNNDRNVNNIDGNTINLNVYSSTDRSDDFNRFYDPVNYK